MDNAYVDLPWFVIISGHVTTTSDYASVFETTLTIDDFVYEQGTGDDKVYYMDLGLRSKDLTKEVKATNTDEIGRIETLHTHHNYYYSKVLKPTTTMDYYVSDKDDDTTKLFDKQFNEDNGVFNIDGGGIDNNVPMVHFEQTNIGSLADKCSDITTFLKDIYTTMSMLSVNEIGSESVDDIYKLKTKRTFNIYLGGEGQSGSGNIFNTISGANKLPYINGSLLSYTATETEIGAGLYKLKSSLGASTPFSDVILYTLVNVGTSIPNEPTQLQFLTDVDNEIYETFTGNEYEYTVEKLNGIPVEPNDQLGEHFIKFGINIDV